jgi:hypothetical protein
LSRANGGTRNTVDQGIEHTVELNVLARLPLPGT